MNGSSRARFGLASDDSESAADEPRLAPDEQADDGNQLEQGGRVTHPAKLRSQG